MSGFPITLGKRSSDQMPVYRPEVTIRSKMFRQFVLLITFCVLLLGGLAFYITTSFITELQIENHLFFGDPRTVGITILAITALLVMLAFLSSTLLARELTDGIGQLSQKMQALRPGMWTFPRTVKSGDEVEGLDRLVSELASRLQATYEHLESMVNERTKALQEEYTLDRAILASIEYGVIAVDREGIITQYNPAATKLMGISEELTGQRIENVLHLHEKTGSIDIQHHPVQDVLRNKLTYRSHPAQHMALMQKQGTVLPVTLLIVPLLQGRTCFGAIAVLADTSVERQLDYLKSEFVTLASHQLRTPLSSLRWYVEMLADNKELSPEHQEHLKEIDAASSRMTRIVDSLLHVAKLEDRAFEPQQEEVDFAAFVRDRSTDWQEGVGKAELSLATEIPAEPVHIHTDTVLAEVILENLWNNAVKYSKKNGNIRVALKPEKDSVVFEITDDGVGIPTADQKRIFEKFFRAKNVLTVSTDGTGLGLYMCKLISDALGAELSFESTEGKGTTFRLKLKR